jgi:hypothetical protein
MLMNVLDPGLYGGVKFVFSICFETDQVVLVLSVVSIRIRNTETNRKIYFLFSQNKPKINQNRLSFGLFRFEPTNFCLFRGHPSFYVAFLFFSVCFKTDLFVSVVSKRVKIPKQTETNNF